MTDTPAAGGDPTYDSGYDAAWEATRAENEALAEEERAAARGIADWYEQAIADATLIETTPATVAGFWEFGGDDSMTVADVVEYGPSSAALTEALAEVVRGYPETFTGTRYEHLLTEPEPQPEPEVGGEEYGPDEELVDEEFDEL